MLIRRVTLPMLLLLWTVAAAVAAERPMNAMKLWKEIDVSACGGCFVSPGDLDGDGRVDFLLSRMGPHTAPASLVALDHDGKKLWELGDAGGRQAAAGSGREPTCRGIASVYDVDCDGRAEVVAELWRDGKPKLCLVDAATGRIRREILSPLDASVRQPKGYRSSRPVPMALIVHGRGSHQPPLIVLKYEASNRIPCHAFGLNHRLERLWHLSTRPTGMGHIPTVADLDGDGCEEIVLGETAVDAAGKILWQQDFGTHADCTDVADLADSPGKEIVLSVCTTGPAFCLAGGNGEILWQKTRRDVPHGQAIWAGDFLPERAGLEVVILRSGHIGDFMTVSGSDGSEIARFQQQKQLTAYPDFPVKVAWNRSQVHCLWVPVDRRLVDGRGRTVGDLGELDDRVARLLRCGTSKSRIAAQAIALDLCGDRREELLLYQPYDGLAVFIFTQDDSDGKPKPYRPQPAAYNFRTYF